MITNAKQLNKLKEISRRYEECIKMSWNPIYMISRKMRNHVSAEHDPFFGKLVHDQ